jgi:hypothetical protein
VKSILTSRKVIWRSDEWKTVNSIPDKITTNLYRWGMWTKHRIIWTAVPPILPFHSGFSFLKNIVQIESLSASGKFFSSREARAKYTRVLYLQEITLPYDWLPCWLQPIIGPFMLSDLPLFIEFTDRTPGSVPFYCFCVPGLLIVHVPKCSSLTSMKRIIL